MTINSHTYEAFLLDFAEGRLTAEEITMLKRFIKSHPELGSWQELTEDLPVLADDELIFFEDKYRLKAPFLSEVELNINPANFDSFAVEYLENELNTAEKEAFERYLEINETSRTAFLIWQKTILQPDKSILFEGKQELKAKPGRKVALFFPWISVAAGLLLLISMGWWFGRDNSRTTSLTNPIHAMNSIKPLHINKIQANEQLIKLDKPEIIKPDKLIPEINFIENTIINNDMTYAAAKPFSWTPVASLFYTDDSKTLFFFYDGSAILAELNDQTAKNQKSLAGLILANTATKMIQTLRSSTPAQEAVLVESTDNSSSKSSLIRLAEAGLKTFNTMTDNELALEKTVNEKGEISRLRFQSESISFSKEYKDANAQ